MSDLKDGDRVITTVDVPPIAKGTTGTVTDASGMQLIVKYDGDSSPGRLTPRDAVKKLGSALAVAAEDIDATTDALEKAATSSEIVWSKPTVTPAAGPATTQVSTSTEIAGQVVILFDDATVDLQTEGGLAGLWAATLLFDLNAPVAKDTTLTLDVRGAVMKSKASQGAILLVLGGNLHLRKYGNGVKDDIFTWRVTQRLRKGATTHSLQLAIMAERRTKEDFIRITVDGIDVAAQ